MAKIWFSFRNIDTSYATKDVITDYSITIKELQRIVGDEAIDNVVRLQGFHGNRQNITALTELETQPIIGLLTADDICQSYYLDGKANEYVYCHDIMIDHEIPITFISTDLRIEYVNSVRRKVKEFKTSSWNNQVGILEVFTHEWALNIEEKGKAEELVEWALEHKYEFEFPEELIMIRSH